MTFRNTHKKEKEPSWKCLKNKYPLAGEQSKCFSFLQVPKRLDLNALSVKNINASEALLETNTKNSFLLRFNA